MEDIRYADPSVPIHFCVDYFDTLAGHEINVHWHRDFEFAVMLRGECDYRLNGGEAIRLRQGDGVFVNSETLHSADNPSPGAVMSCVTFSPLFLTGQPSGTIYADHVLPVLNRRFAGMRLQADRDADVVEEIRAITALGVGGDTVALEYVEHVARLWRLALAAFGRQTIGTAGAIEMRRGRRMRTMLTFIQQHFGDDIDVAAISDSAGIGRTECFRLFKRHTGAGPGDYLLAYRLRRAAVMLASGGGGVAIVGRRCGFRDASYFGKRFKERYGVTPGEYRARHRT
nr:helix-turn-helix domain-containing protein [Bifidobacterium callimiconis]